MSSDESQDDQYNGEENGDEMQVDNNLIEYEAFVCCVWLRFAHGCDFVLEMIMMKRHREIQRKERWILEMINQVCLQHFLFRTDQVRLIHHGVDFSEAKRAKKKEQKDEKLKKKLMKPNAAMVAELLYHWENFRQRDVEKTKRIAIMDQVLQSCKGKIMEVRLAPSCCVPAFSASFFVRASVASENRHVWPRDWTPGTLNFVFTLPFHDDLFPSHRSPCFLERCIYFFRCP
jgi:hypothetical protein